MRIARHTGVALLAMCALSAIVAGSASATPKFLSHPTGALSATAGNTQVFHTPGGGVNVECKVVKLTQGTTTELAFLAILVTVKYESCTAIGLGATVHPVQYIIDANGEVFLENDVKILVPAGACTITIPGAKNHNLRTLKFDNRSDNRLLLLAQVGKITSFGEGAGCTYSEESLGTYTGDVTVALVGGGALRWDP